MVVRPGTRGEAAVSRAGQPGQGGALQGIDNTTSVVHPNGSGSKILAQFGSGSRVTCSWKLGRRFF